MKARPNWFGPAVGYYIVSACSFALVCPVVDYIRMTGTGIFLGSFEAEMSFVFLTLIGIALSAFSLKMVQDLRAFFRWMIVVTIAVGFASSLFLLFHGYLDRKAVAAIYFLPQLLLLFSLKTGNRKPVQTERF